MTFAIELHRWRTGYSADLFYIYMRLGFITLAFSRLLVSEALERIKDKLAEDERASFGEQTFIPHEGFIK